MMELEDEPDLAIAKTGEVRLAAREHVVAVEEDAAGGRAVERPEEVEQRALTDAGLADDGDPRTGLDVEVEALEHRHHCRPVHVALFQLDRLDERHGALFIADHFDRDQARRAPRG